jgi:3-methyladenine DNA glycosylase/8-oxoguanine DNA glycosylase
MMNSKPVRITRVAPDFDLEKNLRFRPFLLFPDDAPKIGVRLNPGRKLVTLELSQKSAGKQVIVAPSRELRPDERTFISSRLAYCLGAREDLSEAYSLCRKDAVLSEHCREIHGLRLFSAFTDFEGLLCILCSHMVSFNQYKKMIQRVCGAYGGAFPNPASVLRNPDALDGCGLGYRKEYVLDAARKCVNGLVVIDELRSIHGVGKYSENIFRLFQLRDYSAFYEDSLTARIARENYGTSIEGLRKQWGSKWCGLLEVLAQKFLNDIHEAGKNRPA